MATPFETFFAGEFQRLLDTVKGERGVLSSGHTIEDASWDRKAAYLLWVAMGRPSVSNRQPQPDPSQLDIEDAIAATMDEDLIG